MVNPINNSKLPETDSINELAEFWDTHDITDFEEQLEEVSEPVFESKSEFRIPLEPDIIKTVIELAKSRGMKPADLIREWIREKIQM
ncbi:MAG: CopG family antitoxin [bacterium]|jgi:predicted phosphatase